MLRFFRRAPARGLMDPLARMSLRQLDDLPPWHEAGPPAVQNHPPAPSIEALVLSGAALTRSA